MSLLSFAKAMRPSLRCSVPRLRRSLVFHASLRCINNSPRLQEISTPPKKPQPVISDFEAALLQLQREKQAMDPVVHEQTQLDSPLPGLGHLLSLVNHNNQQAKWRPKVSPFARSPAQSTDFTAFFAPKRSPLNSSSRDLSMIQLNQELKAALGSLRPGNKNPRRRPNQRLSERGPGSSAPSSYHRREREDSQGGMYATVSKKAVQAVVQPKKVVIGLRQTAAYLSRQLQVKVADILKMLNEDGKRRKANDFINEEQASVVVELFGGIPVKGGMAEVMSEQDYDYASLPARPPVICVMGHVDHGKTTLLDALRKTAMAKREVGGITQGIGAFQVDMGKASATFLDTPGHAAFRAMRARGASSGLTDIIVLVVSVHDGLQPQTLEAIQLAKSSDIPLVVAINKCDLPGADPEMIRRYLASYGVVAEELGGDTLMVNISALHGHGMEQLEEAITLTADIMDLRAPESGPASAFVIESRVEREHGVVVNALVRKGRLAVGDVVVSGLHHGKIRLLMSDSGTAVDSVGPSTPVSIMGLEEVDSISHELMVVESEEKAREIIDARKQMLQEKAEQAAEEAAEMQAKSEAVVDDMARQTIQVRKDGSRHTFTQVQALTPEQIALQKEREAKTLNLFIKADVSGSLEVLLDYIRQIPDDELYVNVIRSYLGEVTEADVEYAAKFKAFLVAFNVKATPHVLTLARAQNLKISQQKIIFHSMDDIRDELSELLPATFEYVVKGVAEVAQTFSLNARRKSDHMAAGLRVKNGKLYHDCEYRVMRERKVLYQGPASSLRHFKESVQEVEKGHECGLVLEGFGDFKVGDTVECVVKQKTKRRVFDDSMARHFERYTMPSYKQGEITTGFGGSGLTMTGKLNNTIQADMDNLAVSHTQVFNQH